MTLPYDQDQLRQWKRQTLAALLAVGLDPQPLGKRVMSLKEPLLKMSKSHNDPRSRIMLNDSSDDIRMKIKAALTDSEEGLSYDPVKRPGVANLLSLMAYMDKSRRSEGQIADEGQALSMRAFKNEVSDTIINGLADIKARYDYFSDATRRQHLQDVMALGDKRARIKAEETMVRIRRLVGTDSI
ncbi:MAG: hypothetical protein Q9181_007489 [Wetmoreana brouardii]